MIKKCRFEHNWNIFNLFEVTEVKKLRIVSIILLLISLAGFILWRFVIALPDRLVRVNGVLMLAAIFTSVFSTVKIKLSKK